MYGPHVEYRGQIFAQSRDRWVPEPKHTDTVGRFDVIHIFAFHETSYLFLMVPSNIEFSLHIRP